MRNTTSAGPSIRWEASGDANRPAIVLLNSIGTDLHLWSPCAAFLSCDLRVIQMDTRGHGASEAPGGDYEMASLADDVIRVMNEAGVDKATIAGVSLGGMMAMELALSYPERVSGLALICTSPEMDRSAWAARVETVRERGMGVIADLTMARFLSADLIESRTDVADAIRQTLLRTDPRGYAGCGAAIRDMNLIKRISDIKAKTIVIAGDRDISTPFAGHGSRIVAAIRDARTVHCDCAHLAQVEKPVAVAAALRALALDEVTA